jgi:hypothetical protein
MKVSIEIPDNKVYSFIELTKDLDYKVSFNNGLEFPQEFIDMLEERANTPHNESRSAFDFLKEMELKYNV